ncbi:MAG: LysR family transcriptional regulator [Gammaproteobacteria bacterium]|nr:MAG: LysR family transcriptional regulator [Gammaproteobacteria bacterium]
MSLLSPQLDAFIAVAQQKTVHSAAILLHVTQTAVTQRIRTLEAKLKTSLFIRTRRGMVLSPEGEALLQYCNAVRELEGEALAKITGAAVDSTIRMAITGPTSIMSSRIIPQCLPIIKKFPNLLVNFDINDVEDRVRLLRSGECQLAILQQENVMPEMEYKILRPERYVLVCTAAWKKRKLRDIIQSERIIDYDASDQMTFHYLKHFDLFELARHDRHYVNRTDALALMLVSGCGYGVLTAEYSKPYVDQNKLIVLNAGKIFENILALAWYPRPEPPKYFAMLVQTIS